MTGYSYPHDYLGADTNVSPDIGETDSLKARQHHRGGTYSDKVLNCGATVVSSIVPAVNLGQHYGHSITDCGAIGRDIHAASEHNGQDQQPSVDYNPYEIPHGSGLLKREP